MADSSGLVVDLVLTAMDHPDLVTGRHQLTDDRATDEAGTAQDADPHARLLVECSSARSCGRTLPDATGT
jgi:hypothetical protein